MNKIKGTLGWLTATALLVVLSVVIILISTKNEPAYGSVVQGSDYHSTTTDGTFTSAKLIQSGGGALGSVTITTAGTGKLTLYDATTTNASLRTKTATTTLANFNITTTVGTYTFDAIFYDGLIVEFTGTNVASSSITYR